MKYFSFFFSTLKTFLIENLWIIPFYIIAIGLVAFGGLQVNILETIIIFGSIMIANTFFIMMSYYSVNNNEKQAGIMYIIANSIYICTGIFVGVKYGQTVYITNNFIYLPIELIMIYNIFIKSPQNPQSEILAKHMVIFAFLFVFSCLMLNTPFTLYGSVLATVITGFAMIMKEKDTKFYSYLMVLAQIGVIGTSVADIIFNYLNNTPISGLNFAYIVFPITIAIGIIKSKPQFFTLKK